MTEWKENGKIKLMIIVGTRPGIIRLAAVIKSVESILIRFLSTPDKTTTTTSMACSSRIWALPIRSCTWTL